MVVQDNVLESAALTQYPVSRWLAGQSQSTSDWVAEEVAVALTYNGLAHAVMMCSPQDYEDFALGFSLSECIVDHPDQIYDIEVITQPDGIEVALTVAGSCFQALKSQRRNLAGRTGCGLCGKESLQQLACHLSPVSNRHPVTSSALEQALSRIGDQQHLFSKTGSAHAAAWCDNEGNLLCLREDVGRHNALDKLIGAGISSGLPLSQGLVIMTSRASYEIVQKAVACGISMIAALSGPTGMAVRMAQDLGLTLIGFARNSSLCVYTHPERII